MSLRNRFAISAQLSAAATAAIVVALASFSGVTLVAQRVSPDRVPALSPADAWDTFSAELTIRRHLLTADGKPSAEAPVVRYRWTRMQRAGGWKSTIEVTGLSAPTIHSTKGPVLLDQPLSVVRIEDDEDGTAVRVLDRRGQPVRLPSIGDRQVLGEPVAGSFRVPALPELAHPDARRRTDESRDWVDAFISVPERTAARREAFKRRFGRANGRIKNLDRFVSTNEAHTVEVLADPSLAVPVEINVARDGVLLAHSTLTYDADSGGTLRRRAVRTEQRLSPGSDRRAVAHVEIANIRLERRGGR